MEGQENLDNIKEKLKKLIDHAESAKKIGNLAEANAFASKINELLLRHNLSKKEVIDHEKEPDVEGLDGGMEVRKSHGDWMAQLLNTLCEYNYCKAIFTSRKRDKTYVSTIIGTHESVEVVSYLYDILKERFQDIAKKEFSEKLKSWQKANCWQLSALLNSGRFNTADLKELKDGMCTIKKPWKYIKQFPSRAKFFKSFFMGANVGLRQKMKEDQERGQKSEMASKINALILVNTSAIQKYMAKHYPDIKTSSHSARKIDHAAYAKGLEAGKGSSVAKGLSNGDTISTKKLN